MGTTNDFNCTPDVRDFRIDENEPMRQRLVDSFLIEPIAKIDSDECN